MMNIDDFIKQIHNAFVSHSNGEYIRIFEETDLDSVTDKYYMTAIKFYRNLDSVSKKVLLSIIRQAQVDTVAGLLALLDGNIILENQDEDLVLLTEDTNQVLSGQLLDFFLCLENDEEA